MGATVKTFKIRKGPSLLRQDLRDLKTMLQRRNLSAGARRSIELEIKDIQKQLEEYDKQLQRQH